MNKIKAFINDYGLKPTRYTIKNNVTIVETKTGGYVFKPNRHQLDLTNLFKYLKSRNFNHYPQLIASDQNYNVFSYYEDTTTPPLQRALDLINLTSLLHNKTTYYQQMNQDEFKAIYEEVKSQIDYLVNYYQDVLTMTEQNIYMSPSEYLFARNFSKLNDALNYCQREIEAWYELIKTKTKKRVVTIHNNLDIDHLIRGDNLYLLSWDQAQIDLPIYDLVVFFKNNAFTLEFDELLRHYESKFPLLEEERKLLFVLLALPPKIEFKEVELDSCKHINQIINNLYKVECLIEPYYPVQEVEKT